MGAARETSRTAIHVPSASMSEEVNILAQGETRAGRYEATEPSAANLQSLRMTGSEAPNNSLATRKASVHHDTSEVTVLARVFGIPTDVSSFRAVFLRGSSFVRRDAPGKGPSNHRLKTLPFWHSLSIDRVFAGLECTSAGLTIAEASRRLVEHGPNELQAAHRISPWTFCSSSSGTCDCHTPRGDGAVRLPRTRRGGGRDCRDRAVRRDLGVHAGIPGRTCD